MSLSIYKQRLLDYFERIYKGDAQRKFTRLFARWIFATPLNPSTLFPMYSIVCKDDLDYAVQIPERLGFHVSIESIIQECESIFQQCVTWEPLSAVKIEDNGFFSYSQHKLFLNRCTDETIFSILQSFYAIVGNKSIHFAIPPRIIELIPQSVELFGSPFNTTAQRYCSPLDIERLYCNSSGTFEFFLTHQIQDNDVLFANPPFVECIMNRLSDLLVTALQTICNITIYVILPAWDDEFQDSHGFQNKQRAFQAHIKLKSTVYCKCELLLSRDEFAFYNYFTNQYCRVGNCVMLVLSNAIHWHYQTASIVQTWLHLSGKHREEASSYWKNKEREMNHFS